MQQALVAPCVAYVGNGQWRRQQYQPDHFHVDPSVVRDHRTVLVEDTFVSGATPFSAAGAMLAAGAKKVLILTLARCVNPNFTAEDHPYRVAMKRPYRLSDWPR